ncbi:cora-domain-containing protein [Testicularia cyperi]|uniref:Cora-domain-containing protein n=1 Tax=Testicularia cyperi TaxID=1882483 RepID=A0A317XXP0_9BASI|nr:cora-domain-containing protein [Testicularia cyperi]
MSSPKNYFGSLSSGRAISPPPDKRASIDGGRDEHPDDHQLEQDLDAARQMSKARGQDTSPPRRSMSDDQAEPYFHEGLRRSPAAIPVRQPAPSSAAARFYQQNRHGSNTSLDSQQHFIDHRHQAHSLSHVHSPSALRARSSLSRTPMRSPNAYFPSTRADNFNDHAIEDDEEGEASHLSRGSYRRPSHQSGSNHSREHSLPHDDEDAHLETRFRRGSIVEDDVCFPMHDTHGGESHVREPDQELSHINAREAYHGANGGVPLGYPFTFDMSALEDFASEERDRIGAATSWNAAGSPPQQGLRMRGAQGRGAGAAAYGISPDSDDATFYSRRPRKLSNSAGAFGSSKYQRKLALFEGGGSAPPPVAGAAPGAEASNSILGSAGLLGASERTRSVDAKTPLLNDETLPSYHGTHDPSRMQASASQSGMSGGGHVGGRSRSQTGAFSNKEKPYRFTFYSNALPSTIHARHLSELPAEGQTFEELFSGRERSSGATPPNGSTGGQSRAPSRAPTINAATARMSSLGQTLGRMEGATAPPTGSNTPVHTGEEAARAMSGLSASRTKALPGGGIRMDSDPEANTWWLDVLSPTDQEMKLLSRVFGIHPLTTEDILMEETREKIELFRNYYLVCFRSFDQDPYSTTYLEPLNMYIIVFREGTLSFHFRGTPHPQNVRRRIKQLKDYINVTSDWISYALIDDITDAFGPLIQSIEYEVDSIDELVLILKEAEQSDMLRRIGTCRKKVMGLLRLMGNKADVVKGLAKRCNENWSVAPKSDIGLYLSDIQDHLITMTQNLNHYEKILSRSHSNYLAQISIEMTDANNQINDVLSKLTALGTVIVPMNVITGLWGMNVNVPGQGVENLHWFAGICSVMVVIAVSGYIAATRYLERSR